MAASSCFCLRFNGSRPSPESQIDPELAKACATSEPPSSEVSKVRSAASRASTRMSSVFRAASQGLAEASPPSGARGRRSVQQRKRGRQGQFNGHWFDGETVLTIELDEGGRCALPGGELSTQDEGCSLQVPSGEIFVGVLLPGGRAISWSDDEIWQRVSDGDYRCSSEGVRAMSRGRVSIRDAEKAEADMTSSFRLRASMNYSSIDASSVEGSPRANHGLAASERSGEASTLPRLLGGQSPEGEGEKV